MRTTGAHAANLWATILRQLFLKNLLSHFLRKWKKTPVGNTAHLPSSEPALLMGASRATFLRVPKINYVVKVFALVLFSLCPDVVYLSLSCDYHCLCLCVILPYTVLIFPWYCSISGIESPVKMYEIARSILLTSFFCALFYLGAWTKSSSCLQKIQVRSKSSEAKRMAWKCISGVDQERRR